MCRRNVKHDHSRVFFETLCGQPVLHIFRPLLCCSPPRRGVRVFYIAWNLELRSILLAVQQLDSIREMPQNNHLSDLLRQCLEIVLDELHITICNVFSATSDSGGDIKRLCDFLLPGLGEWCACIMINCALVKHMRIFRVAP